MPAPLLERQLTAALRLRAEDAMSRTSTTIEHQKLQTVLADQTKDRRRWLVVGLSVAAASVAVVAAGVVLWPSNLGAQRPAVPATGSPDAPTSADVAAAEGIAAATATHDPQAAQRYMVEGKVEPNWGWTKGAIRDAAWEVEYLFEPCVATNTKPPVSVFACPFVMHLLGSREAGEGPFVGNVLRVNVRDGRVIWVDDTKAYETNGMSGYYDSFADWLDETHPKRAWFITKDEQNMTKSELAEMTRLMKHYIPEYVASRA